MGQIKEAMYARKNRKDYTLKEIIGANRNISKKMDILEDYIYNKTGLIVSFGTIMMNPLFDADTVINYDGYVLDNVGSIIPVSKKNLTDELVLEQEDKIIIEKHKDILMKYFKLYNLINKRSIYQIEGTDLKVYIDGCNMILYKESMFQKDVMVDKLNPYSTDFYICAYQGEKIIIGFYGSEIATDCKEVYDMDINTILENISVSGDLEQLIKDNVIPISIFSDDNGFKVIDYSPIEEKMHKLSLFK